MVVVVVRRGFSDEEVAGAAYVLLRIHGCMAVEDLRRVRVRGQALQRGDAQ